MKIKSLNDGVAIEVLDFDISKITEDEGHQIRHLLLDNTVVVFKNQTTLPGHYTNLVSRVGRIMNARDFAWNPVTGEEYSIETRKLLGTYHAVEHPLNWPDPSTYPVQRVTGQKINNKYSGTFATGILDWHTNFNGVRLGTDGVALQGIRGVEGTSTTWLNQLKAYTEMPQELKDRCKDVYCEYEYSPEIWAKGMPKEQEEGMKLLKHKYKLWLIQENAIGRKGLHLLPNAKCNIVSEDKDLFKDLCDYVFQEKFMYQHWYEPGDIVLSDQVLSLHKRDQNDPEILSNRLLHRITFLLSNYGDPTWYEAKNQF